jgi:2-polyprenyl-3-methyl-5-hydroxy-6-metoxy-1,4-benzoquinol methylase
MTREEAERILRAVTYWHYPFKLPWGRAEATKPGHNERHEMRWNHFFRPLLALYGGRLSGKRVLDLGCCQGFWSFEAAKAGARYCLGLDSSESFIAQAEALRIIYGINECEFRQAHLEEDIWWEGLEPFHITLFLGLFYHLTDPIFVLRRALALTVEAIVIDTEIVPAAESALFIVPRDPHEPTTCGSNLTTTIRMVPTRKALADLLQDSGFQVQFLEPRGPLPPEYLSGHRISLIARRR